MHDHAADMAGFFQAYKLPTLASVYGFEHTASPGELLRLLASPVPT